MNHQRHKNLQNRILSRVLEILKTNPHVLGVIVTGSFVKEENDAFSDVDVDCYMNSEGRTGIKEIIKAVSKISPVLSKLWIYDKNALFLFKNGVRLDLNFNKPSEMPNQKLQNCKILYDPKKSLEKGLNKDSSPEEYPHPRWNPQEFEYIEWFFWMFRQVYCWTKRAERKNRKSFNKLVRSVDSLTQIRNGIIDIKLWLHGSWDYMLNIDSEFADRISKTFPRLEAKEILRCTRLLLAEFEKLCKLYCEKREIEYSKGKIKAIKNILDEFDKVS